MYIKRLGYVASVVLLLASSVLSITASSTASADATNLINNPSAVNKDASGNTLNWTPDSWGTSATTLTNTSDGHTDTNALNITTTSRTSGDAKWIPDAVAVTAGSTYTYSDYSKSTVATELDAAYTDANGTVTYNYLAAVPASTTWQQTTIAFKVPTAEVKVQVLHILATTGSLTTDDFSLISGTVTTPPVTPPTTGNLIANPGMETANGQAPASWQTGGYGTNTTAFSYVTGGAHGGSASALINTTAYTNGDAKWYFTPVAVVPSTSYTFSDWYKSTIPTSLVAQYDDGAGTTTYVTLTPTVAAASSWNQTSVTFTTPATAKNLTIFHLIAGVGTLQTDDASLTTGSTTTTPPTNPTTPTVSISAPTANASVNGTVTVTAAASAPTAITKVQFELDGVSLGTAVTAAPYQTSWNTTSVSNGTHTLTAIMTANKVATTSAAVSVTVNNQAAAGSNMILNPGLETVSSTNTKLPANWQSGSWGTNATTFTYVNSSANAHSGTRAVKTQITSYTSGASYWYGTSQPVTAGQMYDFKDYYKSTTPSEVDAGFTMADGSEQDVYIGDAFESPNSWTKFESQFTVPAGAVAVTFYHDIYSVGTLTTDDYSLTPFTYQGFNRAIVTITDDDGYNDFYTNGLPILQKYNLPSTAYIISSYIDDTADGYLPLTNIKALQAAGVEIGSHSVTHPDLSTLNATKQDAELKNSQATLQSDLGVPVTDYAAPYGAYNQQIVTDAAKYYTTYRGVEAGYNAKNNFDPMNLLVQNIDDTTTTAQVQGWLQQAAATNTWLILVYHQINADPATGLYNTYPTGTNSFDEQMAAVKASGLAVETVSQAMKEITPQLTQ